MAKSRRTTHRSSAGKKLYAVRDASGKFKDIQTYERAHRQDLKTTSSGERSSAAKKRCREHWRGWRACDSGPAGSR